MSWFEATFGVQEDASLFMAGFNRVWLRSNPRQDWLAGEHMHYTCPELLKHPRRKGTLRVSHVRGDVRDLHADPANRGATFQVASQFNSLEMVGPTVRREDGISRYEHDHTQGPACAMACGAALLARNYFLPDFDGLADLGRFVGNRGNRYWRMQNGYCLPTASGLVAMAERSRGDADRVRGAVSVGAVRGAEVTLPGCGWTVNQVFCAALPVSYSDQASDHPGWAPFATRVLEAAYEATLAYASWFSRKRTSTNVVYLTRVGGGVFGNRAEWIDAAMERAFELFRDVDLDVRIVEYA